MARLTSRLGHLVGLALGLCAGAGCVGILDLDSYRAGDAGDAGSGDAGGACTSDGCLACILAKCSGAATCLGSGAMAGDFSSGLCSKWGGCLCHCTDATCAGKCEAQKTADVACGGCLDTAIAPSACPAIVDCDAKCKP